MATDSVGRLFAFRHDLASRAAAVAFTSNLALMFLKLVVGALTGSIAVLSDGIDSAQDAVASCFAFISIRVASRPADEEHPYGHGKAESVAAAAQALLIAGGAGYIVYQAVHRLIDRDFTIDPGPGLVALGLTAVVNVGVALYVGRAARITGSPALKADTRHLWTNVAQAAAVFSALGLVAITGNTIYDPIVALGLAVFLLWTAAQVFMVALDDIMDARLPTKEILAVEGCLREQQVNGVRGYHDLRTRKAGRHRYIDLHLLVDPEQSVAAGHAICDAVEDAICRCLPQATVTIHLEPDDGRYRGPWHEESERAEAG
jgi:cation diffusion facilitator family transporter